MGSGGHSPCSSFDGLSIVPVLTEISKTGRSTSKLWTREAAALGINWSQQVIGPGPAFPVAMIPSAHCRGFVRYHSRSRGMAPGSDSMLPSCSVLPPSHLCLFNQVAHRCLVGLPNMNAASLSPLDSCPWCYSIRSQISS